MTADSEHVDDELDAPQSRFIVGIDLGTTNCAVAYIDSQADDRTIRTFPITQLVAAGELERRETLPSFHYEPVPNEVQSGSLDLPWSDETRRWGIGVYARESGRAVPGRLIASAKSWLCHSGVDRRAALLPWHGDSDVETLSPVEVSTRYLRHIRDAWDHDHPDESLSEQDIVLTIPSSFDEVARELTVAAARSAGLPRVVLIEEPQAAFYSWVDAHRDDWDRHVEAGQKILVCDIGGGTADFTLIDVRRGEGEKVQFHRVAVGEHLMLGGDNLDLALAHHVEQKLVGDDRLEPRQWSVLVPTCRHAKETLLADGAPSEYTISLPGVGSRLIGGGLQVAVNRDEIIQLLIDGFLPEVSLDDKPQRRQSGFQEFGLPYAADPAITRYLSAFLKDHAHAEDSGEHENSSDPTRPDIVLFNGGFFDSPILRDRLIDVLQSWFRKEDDDWTPQVLRNDRLDLAVARGAAFFGTVRRGAGVRIVAGLARTYYIGVEGPNGEPAALCLIAAGTEPEDEPKPIDQEFVVRTSEPVEFPIYVSATRLTDRPGDVVPVDEEQMSSLPPIRTVLQTRKKDNLDRVSARLSARLTEVGTLELWCHQIDGPRRWQLHFDVRSSTQTDRDAHLGVAEQAGIVDQETVDAVTEVLESVFARGGTEKPAGLPKRIARRIELSRDEWPPSLLRSMWAGLMDLEAGRRRSAQHEARWLNLLGFSLRPGFGMAADDWRVEQTWRTLRGKQVHGGAACLAEWRILCRRIAGGLSAGRQQDLSSSVLASLRDEHRHRKAGRSKKSHYSTGSHEAAEIWRMLASMELLDQSTRIELGEMVLDLLPHPDLQPLRPALVWSLGRIGARVPAYGPLNVVLPPSVVMDWIERFILLADPAEALTEFALMQLARRTDDRYRDISAPTRDAVIRQLKTGDARAHFVELVRDGGSLGIDEVDLLFGESLPAGLRIA